MARAQWGVVPSIRHWNGDPRRNWTPYFYVGKMSWDGLFLAQHAAQELRKRGIACHIEMIEGEC